MSFEDDIRRIYERKKEKFSIRMRMEQETPPHPEYEFETFEEWKKYHGYDYT